MADLQWDRDFALEQAGDDEELLAELLDLLRQSAASDLAKARAALAVADGQAMADAAHNTKGAAAGLGIEGIRRVADELERVGRGGDLGKAPMLIDQLAALLAQAQSAS